MKVANHCISFVVLKKKQVHWRNNFIPAKTFVSIIQQTFCYHDDNRLREYFCRVIFEPVFLTDYGLETENGIQCEFGIHSGSFCCGVFRHSRDFFSSLNPHSRTFWAKDKNFLCQLSSYSEHNDRSLFRCPKLIPSRC